MALRKRAFFDAAAAALATRGAEWRAIPLLETRSASFDRRFASVSAGKRAQVPYPRLLSRFLKERFPAKTIGGRGDPMRIDFDNAPDAHLSIAITKRQRAIAHLLRSQLANFVKAHPELEAEICGPMEMAT